MLSGTSVLSAT